MFRDFTSFSKDKEMLRNPQNNLECLNNLLRNMNSLRKLFRNYSSKKEGWLTIINR